MRALWSTLMKELSLPARPSLAMTPSLASSRSSHRHFQTEPTEKEERTTRKRRDYILGRHLPDICPSTPCSNLPFPPLFEPFRAKDDKLIPTIIDGKSVAEEIGSEIAEEVCQMKDSIKKVPGLAVILVGQRRDSQTYVHYKIKACQKVGIKSLISELPEGCSEDEVLNIVSNLNQDPSIHGILVQLPLPQHMDEEKILSAISLEKDVEGFHPMNIGNLALRGREPLFIPCAAKACIELLLRCGIGLKGKRAAVIGHCKVVGLPTSLLLQRHHATVSIVHAFTKNPEDITREADIVISAAGVANLVRRSWLRRGTIVIDVGTDPVKDLSSKHGYYLRGDVCFEEALKVASAITPVPGGVGPVTIAMLLSNTLDSAKRAYGLS